MTDLEIIGEGATTKVYRDGNKAIKLYVNAPPNEVENEARLQSHAVKLGLPVPAVLGIRKLDESLAALDMEYIPGKPLLHEKMNKDERRSAIQTLAKLQCMVHTKKACGLPKQHDKISWKIERNSYIDSFVKDRLFSLLESFDTNLDNLCHGDFHPLNILFDGQKHWIIDWVDATAGNPLADACRTYIIFKQYMLRASGIYLQYFCEESGASKSEVIAWLPIIAAARMAENMDDRARGVLIEILDQLEKE